MARVTYSGDPGETYTNTSGKVQYQFLCDWANTCGLCAQYDHMVGPSWPIPLHRNCRCHQAAIWPGDTAAPYTDFRAKIASLPADQQAKVVGVANLKLIESGAVDWSDVVTGQRVRDLQEVVANRKLTVADLAKAGVSTSTAERAHAAVHTSASDLARQKRQELLDRLAAKGVQKADLKKALAEKLAARVGIASGPGGTPTPTPAPTPTPPATPPPAPKSKPKPMPKPKPTPIPVPVVASQRADYLLKAKVKPEVAAKVIEAEALAKAEADAEAAAQALAKAKAKAEAEAEAKKAAHDARLAALAAKKTADEAAAKAKAGWTPRPQSEFKAFKNGRAMDDWGEEAYQRWAMSLPDLERNAIKVYTGDNYKWMNAILRGETPDDMPGGMGMLNARRYIDNAAAGLRRGKAPEAIVTFRGVQDSAAMGLPDPSKLAAGQELTIQGFGSATLSQQKAADFASAEGWVDNMVILQVNQPKGATGAYLNAGELSQYAEEREFLMPPGAKMKFVGMGSPHVLTGGREVPVAVFERVE